MLMKGNPTCSKRIWRNVCKVQWHCVARELWVRKVHDKCQWRSCVADGRGECTLIQEDLAPLQEFLQALDYFLKNLKIESHI